MIKALTELEFVRAGANIRILGNKGNFNSQRMKDSLADETDSAGLAVFVEEKDFRSECKSHMILTKTQRGTAYIRYSNKNCKKMKYLTTDLMNWYIESYNVKCPKNDGGELKGILGKCGPCIKCSKEHFLKPEEI